MAMSTCGKCGGHSFTLTTTEPVGSAVKWHFVQCAKCGVPAGVVDYYTNGAILTAIKKATDPLAKDLKRLQTDVDKLIRQTRK